MPRKAAIPAPPEVFPDGENWPDTTIDIILDATGEEPEAMTEVLALTDPIEDEMPIRAIAVVPAPTSNSVIVGLGALAAMSDEEYAAKKAIMQRGLERVVDIQKTLMIDRQDYGRVPGISKPFLQLPGAEKLANFYGYAVRQEADRVVGDGISSPPLAYHVRSYVHLGSFDGPSVAMGYGEANSWEEKYRWRTEYPECEKCGTRLMKGKPDGKFAGKWYCPGFKGGCWAKYDIGSIPTPGRVENTEPYGLAETLIQIAGKRSFVASIRRATGTSGLFSQDDDSPSVQQQAQDDGGAEQGDPTVEAGPIGVQVSVGAKSENPTAIQMERLKVVAKEKGVGGAKMADLLDLLFKIEVEPTGPAASAAVQKLTGLQMGRLLQVIETGEIIEDHDEELAKALIDENIGAQ